MTEIRPVPSVLEMLGVAEAMGIDDLELAYNNYTRHYDVFFNIEHMAEQTEALLKDMERAGLVEYEDDDRYLKEISVEEAKKIYEAATA